MTRSIDTYQVLWWIVCNSNIQSQHLRPEIYLRKFTRCTKAVVSILELEFSEVVLFIKKFQFIGLFLIWTPTNPSEQFRSSQRDQWLPSQTFQVAFSFLHTWAMSRSVFGLNVDLNHYPPLYLISYSKWVCQGLGTATESLLLFCPPTLRA